jgi:hypothetical protein
VLAQWHKVGRPKLENPSAGRFWRSAAPISDLQDWIKRLEPSQLELAYLGQQMWQDISMMLNDFRA